MKLYEIQGFGAYPTEELLIEGWLDSVKKTLGDKADQAVKVVNNTTSALQVFYRIGTDPKYLDTVTFLIKKDIKQKLKSLGNGPIMTKLKEFIDKIWPEGRKLLDFVKACLICAALKFVGGIVDKFNSAKKIGGEVVSGIKDQASEVVTNLVTKMANLDSMISSMSQASGIFAILKTIGIANDYLFDMLAKVNQKIQSVQVG